jgi:hypothetical protein
MVSAPQQSAAQPELSALAYEILRQAVNLARFQQIKSLSTLRMRLASLYPNANEDIDAALAFWSARVKSKGHPDSIPD